MTTIIYLPAQLKQSRFALRNEAGAPTDTQGRLLSSKQGNEWLDYYTAIAEAERQNKELVWLCSTPFFCVDLDDCIDKSGKLSKTAESILSVCDTYAEISRSGSGLHIIGIGDDYRFYERAGFKQNGVELFNKNKSFTLTGNVYDNRAIIKPAPELLSYIFSNFITDDEEESAEEGTNTLSDDEVLMRVRKEHPYIDTDPGKTPGNRSSKDFSVILSLMFWTNNDVARARRLFEQSARWPKHRQEEKGRQYLDHSFEKASERDKPGYSGKPKSKPSPKQQTISNEPHTFDLDSSYSLTETGNAKLLVNCFGDTFRYCDELDTFFLWNGKYWEPDRSKNKMMNLIKNTLDKQYSNLTSIQDLNKRNAASKWLTYSYNSSRLNGTLFCVKSEPDIHISSKQIDANPNLLCVANGTVNLNDGTLQPHKKEDYITKCIDIEFDPFAKCAVWDKFLLESVCSDSDYAAYLQRAVGYSLHGDPREECFFIISGEAGTGKGTFINAISTMCAEYAQSAQFSTFTEQARQASKASGDIARMRGARIVSAHEANKGEKFNAALLKQLTGRDKITARHLHKAEFEFFPQFTLWITANYNPKFTEGDTGLKRRIRYMKFLHKPAIVDKDLKTKLLSKDSQKAILAWAIAGCVEAMKSGLREPQKIQDWMTEYQEENNILASFFRDEVEKSGNVSVKEFSTAVNNYRVSNNLKGALSSQRINDAMKNLGYEQAHVNNVRVWRGVSLRKLEFNKRMEEL